MDSTDFLLFIQSALGQCFSQFYSKSFSGRLSLPSKEARKLQPDNRNNNIIMARKI